MKDVHRALVQRLMTAGALTEDQLLSAYGDLMRGYGEQLSGALNRAALDKAISVVNTQLDFFSLKVARAHCAADGKFYYGLVNLRHDELAQKGTPLTEAQVLFFQRVKEELVDRQKRQEGESIPWMEAENMRLELANKQKLSSDEANQTLETLVEQMWLHKGVADGEEDDLLLGPRSILQLQYAAA